jgi:hypothetical protein
MNTGINVFDVEFHTLTKDMNERKMLKDNSEESRMQKKRDLSCRRSMRARENKR